VVELASNARPGLSTTELKKRMDASMIANVAIEFSFESTVSFASGPPRPPGPIKHSDMLAVDVGCRVSSGYCSDMGRNISLAPSPEVKDYLDRAVEAHRRSIELIREGALGNDVLEASNRITESTQSTVLIPWSDVATRSALNATTTQCLSLQTSAPWKRTNNP
jgi:Xaa-Pro aminopeptidase